jgi:hypothetical protein
MGDVLQPEISGIFDGRQAETGQRIAVKSFNLRFGN